MPGPRIFGEAELDGSNALWDWLDNLRQTIELGMVWATTNMEEQRHDPGEMCKEGKQWKWKHVPSKAQDGSQSAPSTSRVMLAIF